MLPQFARRTAGLSLRARLLASHRALGRRFLGSDAQEVDPSPPPTRSFASHLRALRDPPSEERENPYKPAKVTVEHPYEVVEERPYEPAPVQARETPPPEPKIPLEQLNAEAEEARLQRIAQRDTSITPLRHTGLNAEILNILEDALLEPEVMHNRYMAIPLRKGISVLLRYPDRITSTEQIAELTGVGRQVQLRLDLYFAGRPQSDLAGHKVDLSVAQKACKRLQLVENMTRKRAETFVKDGAKNVEDLKLPEHYLRLTSEERAGVEFYPKLQPRAMKPPDHAAVERAIRETLEPLGIEVHSAGPAVRGHREFTELHFSVFHPQFDLMRSPTIPLFVPKRTAPTKKRKQLSAVPSKPYEKGAPVPAVLPEAAQKSLLRKTIIAPLAEAGIIGTNISLTAHDFHGVVRVPIFEGFQVKSKVIAKADETMEERLKAMEERKGIFTYLHIHLIPQTARAAGLLHWIGDDQFNEYVCAEAAKLGLLSDRFGLWRWDQKNKAWTRLDELKTEQEHLKEVGMAWVEPERRNFRHVYMQPKSKTQKNLVWKDMLQ